MGILIKDFEKLKTKLVKGIVKDLLIMLRKRVPVDTETLMNEGLQVIDYEQNGITYIDCFVNNLTLDYGRQSIRADALGMILDVGLKGGRQLLRTRSRPQNPARTPTKGWFTNDFYNDVVLYLKRNQFEKWLN
jgi:hypothetical protein